MVDDIETPFGYKRGEGIDAGFGEHHWICDRDRVTTDPMFEKLGPIDGKISGAGNNRHVFYCKTYKLILSNNCSRQIGTYQIEAAQLGAQQNLETIGR